MGTHLFSSNASFILFKLFFGLFWTVFGLEVNSPNGRYVGVCYFGLGKTDTKKIAGDEGRPGSPRIWS